MSKKTEDARHSNTLAAGDTPPSLDFETALSELETLVEKLESGELSLAESLAQFEKGIHLSRECHQILEQARQTVEILVDGQAQPFDSAADETTL